MPYFAPGDPFPRKTLAELDAEETTADKVDTWNERLPWVRWSLLTLGVLMLAGAAVRWCWI